MAFRPSAAILLAAGALGAAAPADTPQRLITQSRARLAQGDFAGAARIAEGAVARFPRDANMVLLAGNFVRDRYGFAAALPWYDRALVLDPGHIGALLDKAATLGDLGQTVAMLGVTRRILDLDPKQPMAFYLQAILVARAGRWDLARSLYYRTGGRIDALPGVRLLHGAIEVKAGAYEAAIAALQPVVDAQPENRAARRLLGLALWKSGDGDTAIAALEPIADESYALTLMARAAEAQGDRLRAADWLDRADRAASPHATASDLASAAAAANMRLSQANAVRLAAAATGTGAARVLDTYLAQHPRDAGVLRLAGDDALAHQSWARAAAAFKLVRVATGTGDAATETNLAWAWTNLGRTGDAFPLARHAYALAPGSAPAAALYGHLLARGGDRLAGSALLEKSLTLAPSAPLYRRWLATARAR